MVNTLKAAEVCCSAWWQAPGLRSASVGLSTTRPRKQGDASVLTAILPTLYGASPFRSALGRSAW